MCPGSFDPITNGHLDIIERASELYDEMIVAVLVNPEKAGMFDVDTRMAMIAESTAHLSGVTVDSFHGLLVDYCRDQGVEVIVKGLRAISDSEYEVQMAQMNRGLSGIETVFMPTGPEHGHLSSSLIKAVAHFGGDVAHLVPPPVLQRLLARRED
ncbi:MAG: pantetheine-phosphate adenylyltransferase [Actinomycetota bacterium]|nr:pantetheine-phosphate adenylyltransferase [Actinomycetota bacterium]